MHKCVGACTRAAEGFDVDQALSRVFQITQAARSASWRAVSWTCLTLLDSPDPVRVGVGRSRFGSWWPTQISYVCTIPVPKCQVSAEPYV